MATYLIQLLQYHVLRLLQHLLQLHILHLLVKLRPMLLLHLDGRAAHLTLSSELIHSSLPLQRVELLLSIVDLGQILRCRVVRVVEMHLIDLTHF